MVPIYTTQRPGYRLKHIKNAIAIGSGKGGVGKSTFTVNMAVALAQTGVNVGILDADIYGPSIPTMLGNKEKVTLHDDHYQPIYAHGIQAMSMGYLTGHAQEALIWRGPMLAKALLEMINHTAWDNLDYLLIDLPPGTGDIQLSLAQKIPLAGGIVITSPQHIATQDADKAIRLFQKTQIPCLGVVENFSTYRCEQCGHDHMLFDQGGAQALATQHHIPYLGHLPLHPSIGQGADRGMPIVLTDHPMKQAFENILQTVMTRLRQQPIIDSSS